METLAKVRAIDTAINIITEQRKQTEETSAIFVRYDLDATYLSERNNEYKNLLSTLNEIKDDLIGAV